MYSTDRRVLFQQRSDTADDICSDVLHGDKIGCATRVRVCTVSLIFHWNWKMKNGKWPPISHFSYPIENGKWKMDVHFPFSIFHSRAKMKNGSPFFIFHFPRTRKNRAGLRHVRGVRPNRAAKFRGAAILDTKNSVYVNLPHFDG